MIRPGRFAAVPLNRAKQCGRAVLGHPAVLRGRAVLRHPAVLRGRAVFQRRTVFQSRTVLLTALIVALVAVLVPGLVTGRDKAGPSSAAARRFSPDAEAAPGAGSTPGVPAGPVPKHLAFRARTLDGGTFSGASLAGKPAVMWFWAPWCGACRGEAPGVAEVAKRFQGRVAFVGMAGRDAESEMKSFVADTGAESIPHVMDVDGELWASFGVTGQPSYAFVAADGSLELIPASLTTEELVAKTTALAG